MAAWGALAALNAFVSPTGILLACVAVLCVQFLWEFLLRRTHLPGAGRRCWVWRICLALCFVMVTCHLLAWRYGAVVPGLKRFTNTGRLELGWMSAGRPVDLAIHYTTLSTFKFPAPPVPETLSFRQSAKDTTPAWVVSEGGKLVSKTGAATLPWTPQGLARMTEDLYGLKVAPEDELFVASCYDSIAKQEGFPLIAAPVSTPGGLRANLAISGSSTAAFSYTPLASALLACVAVCLFGVAIHFTAKATMG
ncbi:hypothetical protein llg_09620 [Luteolibacter sp. LG18]|nr:hypothetical protein llg_09620 [Luteolibacter sp. LG18]